MSIIFVRVPQCAALSAFGLTATVVYLCFVGVASQECAVVETVPRLFVCFVGYQIPDDNENHRSSCFAGQCGKY